MHPILECNQAHIAGVEVQIEFGRHLFKFSLFQSEPPRSKIEAAGPVIRIEERPRAPSSEFAVIDDQNASFAWSINVLKMSGPGALATWKIDT